MPGVRLALQYSDFPRWFCCPIFKLQTIMPEDSVSIAQQFDKKPKVETLPKV